MGSMPADSIIETIPNESDICDKISAHKLYQCYCLHQNINLVD